MADKAGLLAEMRETPRKNRMLGLLADALTGINAFATEQDPRSVNMQHKALGLLSNMFLAPVAKTVERMSYGKPLDGLLGAP